MPLDFINTIDFHHFHHQLSNTICHTGVGQGIQRRKPKKFYLSISVNILIIHYIITTTIVL